MEIKTATGDVCTLKLKIGETLIIEIEPDGANAQFVGARRIGFIVGTLLLGNKAAISIQFPSGRTFERDEEPLTRYVIDNPNGATAQTLATRHGDDEHEILFRLMR